MGEIKRLPDSELEVMLIIWHQGKTMHTGEILQKLHEKKQCHLQAVQSTLNRLQGKKFISCQKIGRLNYYTSLINERIYREQETETFVEQMYHNSPVKLITALLSRGTMSQKDKEEIRQLLEDDRS